MNALAIQQQLDQTDGPLFKNNGYYQPLRRREPTARYKSLNRNGRPMQCKGDKS